MDKTVEMEQMMERIQIETKKFDRLTGYIKTGNLEVFIYPETHKCQVLVDGKLVPYVAKIEVTADANADEPFTKLLLTIGLL